MVNVRLIRTFGTEKFLLDSPWTIRCISRRSARTASFSTSSSRGASSEKDAVGSVAQRDYTSKSEESIAKTEQSLIASSTQENEIAPTEQPSRWSETLAFLDNLWVERTGSGEITKLKEQVSDASFEFDKATREVGVARRTLERSLLDYETVSSRHTSLLQKRDEWTPDDAAIFAQLVNKEVSARQQLEDARTKLQKLELDLSGCQLTYINALRKRYHEEQIWQDKWRVIGTYGTWSLIVLNSFVFLASQYIHRMREMSRIKAIETLINEKIPSPVTVTSDSNRSSMAMAAESSSPADKRTIEIEDATTSVETSHTEASAEVGHSTFSASEPSTEATNKPDDRSAPSTSQEDSENMEYEEVAVGNGRAQQLKRSLLRTAADIELKSKKVLVQAIDWIQAKELTSSVHLPSVALGAATSGAIFCAVLAVSGRR